MTEVKFTRAMDRVDSLKDVGRWSFRQVKKQRNLPVGTKTHWDYLMDEVVSGRLQSLLVYAYRNGCRNGCVSTFGRRENGS